MGLKAEHNLFRMEGVALGLKYSVTKGVTRGDKPTENYLCTAPQLYSAFMVFQLFVLALVV